MTLYTLEINGTPVDILSVRFEKSNTKDPDPWSADLAYLTTSVSKGDSITIKRDGTAIFKGIVEEITTKWGPDGAVKTISGRHTKVKLWRKWIERYSQKDAKLKQGFWVAYYPHEIVRFFLHPSRSDFDPDNEYTRVGWGIDPTDWTITASDRQDQSHHEIKVKNRLDTVGWRTSSAQANGTYIQVDLGSAKTICGIRIENRTLYPYEFVRNYKIEGSTTGAFSGEEVLLASKTNNRAINIVHSWSPASYRYIRITCTASHSERWSISDIFIYESDGEISGISEGTLSEHLPFNCASLTQNASSGQAYVYVKEYWRFQVGDKVIIGDDNAEEKNVVKTVDSTNERLEMENALSNTYTTAANGFVLNYDRFTPINLEYMRRTEAIDEIVKRCMTNNVQWQWEVTDDGVVNMGLRTGTDKSATVSFVRATNIESALKEDSDKTRVDRVLVIGKGKGYLQDKTMSGWVGSGEYEHVEIDTSLETPEACKARAETILEKLGSGKQQEKLIVDDTYSTNTWSVDDDVTITDSLTGMSGSYRIKKVVRQWNDDGEKVTIHTTTIRPKDSDFISHLIREQRINQMTKDEYPDYIFEDVTGKPEFILFFEAEELVLDPDVTITTDPAASNGKYIYMSSLNSGDVMWGPGASLEPGKYKVGFLCQVSDNSSSSDLATFDIYSSTKGSTFASTTIKPNQFSQANKWYVVYLAFEIEEQSYDDIEFRIHSFQSGITNLMCDWVGVVFAGYNSVEDIDMDYPAGPPSVPTNLTATAKPLAVLLEWDANTEFDFDYYEVYKNTVNNSGTATKIAEVDSNYFTYRATSAEYGTTLYFWVKAVDWSGNVSSFSAVASAAPAQVDTVELAPDSVTSAKILDGAVITAKLDDLAVTNAKIAAAAISSDKIVDGAIIESKLATAAVSATKILDGAVETAKLDDLAVTTAKIDNLAITTGKIAAGAVTTTKLTIYSIFIDGLSITDNSPSAGYVSWSACTLQYEGTSYSISSGNTNLKYIYWDKPNTTFSASNTKPSWQADRYMIAINEGGTHTIVWNATLIHGGTLITGSITAQEIAANTITANEIASNTITAAEIATNTITSTEIAAAAITATELAAGAVTTDKLAAGAVTTRKLTVYSIFLENINFTDNDPVAGSVSWTAGYLQYEGTTYNISSGNTSDKYIYWDKPDTAFSTSATKPAWQADRYMIGLNISGTFYPVWNATYIHGGTLITGTVTAQEITADWITGKKFRTDSAVSWTDGSGTQGVMFSPDGIKGKDINGDPTFFLDSNSGEIAVYGDGNFTIRKADKTFLAYLDGTVYSGRDAVHLQTTTADILLDAAGYHIWLRSDGDIDFGGSAVVDMNAVRLVIPTRTVSDPASPRSGEIWLRTDL